MKNINKKYIIFPLIMIFYSLFLLSDMNFFVNIYKKIFQFDFLNNMLSNYAYQNSSLYNIANEAIYSLNSIYQLFTYVVLFSVLTIAIYPYLVNDFDNLRKNNRNIISIIAIGFLIYYGSNIVANMVVMFLQNIFKVTPVSMNQESLVIMIQSSKINSLIMMLSIVFLGPLVEEIIFRKSFFELIPNKIVAIIISSLCFGLLHTFRYDYTAIELLIVTIPYCVSGIAFGWCYYKTDNVFTGYFLHAILNLISFLLISGGIV